MVKKTNLRTDLMNLLRQHAKQGWTVSKLLKRLRRHYPETEITSTIGRLIDDGTIYKTKKGNIKLSPKKRSSGIAIEGVIDLTDKGYAFLVSPQAERDVFIPRNGLAKAFDGDRVRVRIHHDKRRGRAEGEVVEVLSRAQHAYVGVIEIRAGRMFVRTDRKKVTVDIRILDDEPKLAPGQKVVVQLAEWPDNQSYPNGSIVEVLGTLGEHDVEMKSILVNSGFRLEFPKAVIEESERIPHAIPADEIKRRRDMRSVLTFTIDPDDAKDFDDALSFKILDDDTYEIGIHIADVAHYVKPGKALDKEAYKRATSVYLVDRVLPMLPEQLSNVICSLRPKEDKLCFSAVLHMDSDAKILNSWFGRTVIHSNHRYTYGEAQEVIKGDGDDELSHAIRKVNGLARKLRSKRLQNGAIAFESKELKFMLDAEGKPIGVQLKEHFEAHELIEEFMLQANRSVAKALGDYALKSGGATVYRIHDAPDPERVEDFARMAKYFGHKIKTDTPRQLADSINDLIRNVKGKPEHDLLATLAIRCMAKAVYAARNIGHYGLNFKHYTHFTSPIRRYPDVMIHRLVEKMLAGTKLDESDKLDAQCVHCSWMERKAMEAERESVKLKQVEFMEKLVGQEASGVITGVTHFGLFVSINAGEAEGLIPLDSIDIDRMVYDQRTFSVEGAHTGLRLMLGDEVTIKIESTNREKRQIDLRLIAAKGKLLDHYA